MSDTKPAAPEQSDAPELTDAQTDAQQEADFGAGFDSGKPTPPTKAGKADKTDAAAAPRQQVEADKPEYAQLTVKELAELKAAAAKTASYDQQLSKAFGTIGNLQKQLAEQMKQGEKKRGELPRDEYEDLQRDYPEIARKLRPVLERMNAAGATDADVERFQAVVARERAKHELEVLEDAYPDWRTITGAVDATQQQPDPENPFRKWLATKDQAYQTKVNTSESAAVIGRAIRNFQREAAAAQAKPVNGTPRDSARADRIRSAVQPRGDNRSGAEPGTSDQDEFEAGFNAR